ncbi:MAG: SUMF1/EgtB/PvdO family nonheme iron enzyme [Candidatus Thiodiazotropha sp.]
MFRVFISSTSRDLEDYREKAAMAAHAAGLNADMQENWTAEDHPPLDACLERVSEADLLVAIIAHRYGWVPDDKRHNPEGKSITWLECENAVDSGKDVLAFVIDEGADWPGDLKEEAELNRALELEDSDKADALFKLTRQRIQQLKTFKHWLESRGLHRSFRTKHELKLEVERALKHWCSQQAGEEASPQFQAIEPSTIPPAYLAWLRHECESVELLGLEAQELHPTHLSQVYVPALTSAKQPQEEEQSESDRGSSRADWPQLHYLSSRLVDRPQYDLLLDRLDKESLYVPGDPGAGKSTFCRWLALVAASDTLPSHPIPDPEEYRETYPEDLGVRLPVFVPLREFWQCLTLERGSQQLGRDALVSTLGQWLEERVGPERITRQTFVALLKAGRVLLILDGVDEVPLTDGFADQEAYPRACLLAALADGQKMWTQAGNRLLITSRPYGLHAEDIQRINLPEALLASLEEPMQRLFIQRWYAAADPAKAEEKAQGLIDHLGGRPDLAELQRNPMLLTALCVRYGEGRRLPQDRHDLYDKIVNNVLFNRYKGEAHQRSAVRGRLAAIAYEMHTGVSIQLRRTTPEAAVSLDEVERILSDYAELNPATEAGSCAAAQRRDELLARSGLLLGRGSGKAGFYHFSFQEFLAAEHLARTRRDPDWFDAIIKQHASVPEWRLTLGFLFGRMLERNGEQWALETTEGLLKTLGRALVNENPASAVLCADWLEVLQRKCLNLGALKDGYTRLALDAIEDEIPLQERFRLGIVLGLLGDPRLGDPRDPRWREQGFIEVPTGCYAYQKGHQEIEQPFLIGRYPVTNSQFALFIEDGGYQDRQCWSDAGWKWREKEAISEPEYWGNSRYNAPNQPVVGVSYWEADAFCRWVGGRLPREQEWEAAARGTQGHRYPWGDIWEDGICNTHESGLNNTSPVGLFPRSRQQSFGIEELAGNAYEWCLNKRENPKDIFIGDSGKSRVLCGGSWLYDQDLARADSRLNDHPDFRNSDIGFRVVCESPIC